MTFTGMDTDAARRVAERIDDAAHALDRRASALRSAIAASEDHWRGADGDRFRRTAVRADRDLTRLLLEHLWEASRRLRGQADEQDATSVPLLPPPAPFNPFLMNGSPAPGAGARARPGTGENDRVWDPRDAWDVLARHIGLDGPRAWGFGVLAEEVRRAFQGHDRDLRRDAGHLARTVDRLIRWDPDDPLLSAELVATGLVSAGAFAKAALPTELGVSLRILDEGRLDPDLEAVPLPDRPGGRAPEDVHDLVAAAGEADGDSGLVSRAFGGSQAVRVEQLEGDDGQARWIVTMPGTQTPAWAPSALGGSSQPADWASNLRMMAGQRTVSMDAVEASMAAAGIRPDEPVLFVGHSQGGLIASHLAAEPGFTDRYDLQALVTAGAPIGSADIPTDVSALSLEHGRFEAGVTLAGPGGPSLTVSGDVVPELDLMGDRTVAEHVETVRLDPIVGELDLQVGDGDMAPWTAFVQNHHADGYTGSLDELRQDPAPDAVSRAESDPDLAQFLDGRARSVGATEFRASRL